MKTFKIALIGCGKIANKHLKAINYFAHENKKIKIATELAALVDPTSKNAESLLGKYKGTNEVKCFSSMEEMYESGLPVDIVMITTPSGLHYVQTKLALENHCHVFVEKPITLKTKEAAELVEIAEQNHLQIAVGHIYRYFPLIGEIMKDVNQERFGKALYGTVQVRWGHDQAYYDQAAWRGTRALDGGAIMNQSIHALDLMRWLLGEPELIAAKGAISTQIHQMESEDLGFGIFSFEDDKWLLLEGTTNTHPERPEAGFFVKFEKGEIRAHLLKKKITFSVLDENLKELKNHYLKQDVKARIKALGFSYLKQMGNPHTAILYDLLKSIETGKSPLANGAGGLEALKLVRALYNDADVVD